MTARAKAGAATPKAAASASQFATPDGGPWGRCFTPRAKGEKRYWLVKSEPDVFSWDHLMAAPKRTTHWNGVRNFSARNFMRDGMKKGDLVFFYHSNADPSAIVGICEVAREAYPDTTAFEPGDYYDERSTPKDPIWFMVDIRAVKALKRPVSLADLKAEPSLSQMALIRTGRLSVIPITPTEWETIVAMGSR